MTKYDPEAIIRALDHHRAQGRIRDWRFSRMAPQKFHLFVDLVNGESSYEIRTIREASVFVHGLASAAMADSRSRRELPIYLLPIDPDGKPSGSASGPFPSIQAAEQVAIDSDVLVTQITMQDRRDRM